MNVFFFRRFYRGAVGKKINFPECQTSENYISKFSIITLEKKSLSIIFEAKRQKKMFRRKKMLTVNLPWNDPYISKKFLNSVTYIYFEEIFLWKKERFHSDGYRAQVLSIAGRMLCHLSYGGSTTILTETC